MILGLTNRKNSIGAKAVKLQVLLDAGYNVPSFVVLSPEYVEDVENRDVPTDVSKYLQGDKYAVRSAAFSEDADSGSMAGQFLTKLSVSFADLLHSTIEVREDAQRKGATKDKNFSIIIQEFIEPEYAGVLFTRNPLEGHQMVLEYVAGRGEQVVSGKKSTSVSLHSKTIAKLAKQLPFIKELVLQGKRLKSCLVFLKILSGLTPRVSCISYNHVQLRHFHKQCIKSTCI